MNEIFAHDHQMEEIFVILNQNIEILLDVDVNEKLNIFYFNFEVCCFKSVAR